MRDCRTASVPGADANVRSRFSQKNSMHANMPGCFETDVIVCHRMSKNFQHFSNHQSACARATSSYLNGWRTQKQKSRAWTTLAS